MNNIMELIKVSMGKNVYKYMLDKNVIEIMLNNDKTMFIDTLDKGLIQIEESIDSSKALNLIKIIASSMNRVINEKIPVLSATLPETNERFEALIPPVVESPVFSIRKPSIYIFTLNNYLDNNTLTKKQYEVIKASVKDRKNILVIGGTGTGKTTLCNAIIDEMKDYNQRIITIEDTKELQTTSKNVVSLITSLNCTTRDLLRSTMRLRPDRICLGEVRGAEALNLLKAWNSGHNGGICTIHANSCEGGLEQLEQYILEASNTPQRKLIANTIDILINIRRKDNKRYIEKIVKLKEYNENYILEEI